MLNSFLPLKAEKSADNFWQWRLTHNKKPQTLVHILNKWHSILSSHWNMWCYTFCNDRLETGPKPCWQKQCSQMDELHIWCFSSKGAWFVLLVLLHLQQITNILGQRFLRSRTRMNTRGVACIKWYNPHSFEFKQTSDTGDFGYGFRMRRKTVRKNSRSTPTSTGFRLSDLPLTFQEEYTWVICICHAAACSAAHHDHGSSFTHIHATCNTTTETLTPSLHHSRVTLSTDDLSARWHWRSTRLFLIKIESLIYKCILDNWQAGH